jgi:hypothetical protein
LLGHKRENSEPFIKSKKNLELFSGTLKQLTCQPTVGYAV